MQRLRLIIFLAATFFCATAKAQLTFQKAYGGTYYENNDVMYGSGCITNLSEGGLAICQGTASYGTPQDPYDVSIYFLKLKPNGDTLATRTYSAGANSFGRSIFQLPDSGFIIGAHVPGYGGGMSLIRTDAWGDTLWARRFHGSPQGYGYFGFPFSDGGFVACGMQEPALMFKWHSASLGKVDAAGSLVFGRTYMHPIGQNQQTYMGFTSACEAVEASGNGILATGYYRTSLNGNSDILLVRTDGAGNVMWAKRYGGPLAEMGHTVKELPDQSILITGQTTSYGPGGDDAFVLKTDPQGNIIYSFAYGTSAFEWSNSLALPANGDIVLCGNHQPNPSSLNTDAYLLSLDPNGAINWSQRYGAGNDDLGNSVTATPDGGFALTGNTKSYGAGNTDLYCVKTDAQGHVNCFVNPANFTATPAPFTTVSLSLIDGAPLQLSPLPLSVSSGGVVTHICTTLGEEEMMTGNDVEIYPNPAAGEATVMAGLKGEVQVTLFSATGQQVYAAKQFLADRSSTFTIGLEQVSAGVYFLRIEGKEKVLQKKLLVSGN